MTAEDLRQLSTSVIGVRCSQETERYYHQAEHDPRYCFELFRRAIEEREEGAWDILHAQYASLVATWVRRHSAFSSGGEETQYFVSRAFEKFWLVMTPVKFREHSTSLGGLLQYLKMCVGSVVLDHARANRWTDETSELQAKNVSNNLSLENKISRESDAEELWNTIKTLANDELEHLVLYCSFVLDMKAREILKSYPQKFTGVEEVYRLKERFLKRLRRNPALERYAER